MVLGKELLLVAIGVVIMVKEVKNKNKQQQWTLLRQEGSFVCTGHVSMICRLLSRDMVCNVLYARCQEIREDLVIGMESELGAIIQKPLPHLEPKENKRHFGIPDEAETTEIIPAA